MFPALLITASPSAPLSDGTAAHNATTPTPATPPGSSQARNTAVVLAAVFCIAFLVTVIVVLLCVIKFRTSKMKTGTYQISESNGGEHLGSNAGFSNMMYPGNNYERNVCSFGVLF